MICAVLAATAMVSASCDAVSAEPPQVAAPATSGTEAYLGAIARWGARGQALLHEQALVLGELRLTADAIKEGRSPFDPAQAHIWAEGLRGRYAALQQEAETFRRTPPPAPPSAGSGQASTRRLAEIMAGMAPLMADAVSSSAPLVERAIALIERAAGGDASAAAELSKVAPDLMIAALTSENVMARGEAAMMEGMDHPQVDLLDATVQTNLAAIEIELIERDGPAHDRAASRTLILKAAARVEADADAMERHAKAMQASYLPRLAAGSPLEDKLRRVLLSYVESAAVERDIARVLRDVAAKAGDPAVSPQAVHDEFTRIYPFGRRRIELFNLRRSMVSQ